MTAPRPAQGAQRRSVLALALALAVSAVFLYLSFRNAHLARVWAVITHVSVGALALWLPLRLTAFLMAAARTHVMMRGLHRYSPWLLFKSVLLGFAVNNLIPFRAGELARVGYLADGGGLSASTCLAVVALERALDLLALAILLLCVMPAVAVDLPIGAASYLLVGGVVVAVAAALAASRRPAAFIALCAGAGGLLGRSVRTFIEQRAERFAHGLSTLQSASSTMAAIGLSMAMWVLAALGMQIWLWAFGLALPWYAPAVIIAFLSVGMAVPASPGHLGTYHFCIISALTMLGVAEAPATSFAIVAHAVAVVPFTLLSLPIMAGGGVRLALIGARRSPGDA